jgi:hypothetical protein
MTTAVLLPWDREMRRTGAKRRSGAPRPQIDDAERMRRSTRPMHTGSLSPTQQLLPPECVQSVDAGSRVARGPHCSPGGDADAGRDPDLPHGPSRCLAGDRPYHLVESPRTGTSSRRWFSTATLAKPSSGATWLTTEHLHIAWILGAAGAPLRARPLEAADCVCACLGFLLRGARCGSRLRSGPRLESARHGALCHPSRPRSSAATEATGSHSVERRNRGGHHGRAPRAGSASSPIPRRPCRNGPAGRGG